MPIQVSPELTLIWYRPTLYQLSVHKTEKGLGKGIFALTFEVDVYVAKSLLLFS